MLIWLTRTEIPLFGSLVTFCPIRALWDILTNQKPGSDFDSEESQRSQIGSANSKSDRMRPEVLFRFLPRSPGKHKQAKKQTSGAQGMYILIWVTY